MSYRDPRIVSARRMIKKLPYFQHATKEEIQDAVFMMEQAFYETNQTIIRSRENSKLIIFILSGCVTVKTEFDGNPFVLDYLRQGSIIHYRSFMLEELIHVDFVCQTQVKALHLTQEGLSKLLFYHKNFSKHFKLF